MSVETKDELVEHSQLLHDGDQHGAVKNTSIAEPGNTSP